MAQEKRKYAVVDLEATNAGSSAKIIQVGIIIIEDGLISQTYETDINPHEKLDEHIRQLTGLSNRRLSKAPEFSQVAAEIYALIHDAIFVAHNVKFDANLLAEALFWEGFDLLTPRVDTVELAQVFFPTLEKYNLSVLCQELEIPLENAHTAMPDALATAQLFLKIQEKIKQLPKGLVETLLGFSDQLIYESSLAIKDVWEAMPDLQVNDLIERQGIYLRKPAQFKKAKQLSQDFEHNISLLDLEERPEQVTFAHYVEQALASEQVSFLQAQTGLGKTYGYLLPALSRTKQKILISVPTKILQDQLMQKEAQQIADLFAISFHSLKSPANYLKLDSFYASLKRDGDNRLLNRCKMQILVWLTETQTGDLDEIGQKHRYQAFFRELAHDGKLSKQSLFYGEDFWQLGQARAFESRVVITNHAYFLTRLEDDPAFVDGHVLIVDEAQKLFLALENLSRYSLYLTQSMQEIQQELQNHPSLLTRRLLESIQFELNRVIEAFRYQKEQELDASILEKIRQDLSELDATLLPDLRHALAAKYNQFWLEEENFDTYRTLYLKSASLDLLNFKDMLPEKTKSLFVSATLEISRKVNLPQLLGFDQADFYALEPSHRPKQKIWLDKDFPNVTSLSLPTYAELIVERIQSLATTSYPILVLFTSKELLLEVSERLNLAHLAQYKNGDAAHIKRRFDKGESAILLGSASFWEGTDFASQERMIQIITRIPFDNPADFFTQKINRKLRQDGKNSFFDYSLPLAILRLKQALGRTVRQQEQASAVIVLDNRISTKRYGQQIRQSLAEQVSVTESRSKGLARAVKAFFKELDQED